MGNSNVTTDGSSWSQYVHNLVAVTLKVPVKDISFCNDRKTVTQDISFCNDRKADISLCNDLKAVMQDISFCNDRKADISLFNDLKAVMQDNSLCLTRETNFTYQDIKPAGPYFLRNSHHVNHGSSEV